VNDNPVKWFTKNHRIRVADRVLNSHFGGTYTAYLTLNSQAEVSDQVPAELLAQHNLPAMGWDELKAWANEQDEKSIEPLNVLADEINYMDPAGLTPASLKQQLEANASLDQTKVAALLVALPAAAGEALMDQALNWCDERLADSMTAQVEAAETRASAPAFKQPATLAYLEELQAFLDAHPLVGKTSSAIDALKKANYELSYMEGADNSTHYAVPETTPAIAQVFTQLEGMKKKDSLFHLVSRDYQQANLWVQLKSGDNQDMEQVVSAVKQYFKDHPLPAELESGWAGLAYINVVWQEKMVVGMLGSLASSFAVVLIMMMILFRSPLFGLLSMLPLTVTITLIYGIIGLAGKDYDMPTAVLSALTLGLSIDFAIHFLQRSRELCNESGDWQETLRRMFKEPAKAISRNAIIISVGFTPLLLAPLLPYKTVGFFLATIMAVSWFGTLVLLTSIATVLRKRLFNIS
jgi:hypothetical protein